MQENQTPVIYYTGNSWQRPGDAVTISGSRVGAVTDALLLTRLPDTVSSPIPGLIRRNFYDRTDETTDARLLKEPVWNEAEAIRPDILQRTKNSIKFILPDSLSEGVFAVKLMSADSMNADLMSANPMNADSASAEPAYACLNIPDIHFVLGGEGEGAHPGGTIRICGTCLAPENAPVSPRIYLKHCEMPFGEQDYFLDGVTVHSLYSVSCCLPEHIRPGTYEVFLHNGFGGDTAWSLGSRIVIAEDPKKDWPQDVFNVKDYGAMGKGTLHNDTPAVISALAAAEKNGGGTVYFPKGTYTLVYTLQVPEHVVLKGDGIRKTRLVWLPYLWDFGELPESMISLKGNAEISDIDITGTRMGPLFTAFPDYVNNRMPENISIHDCRIYLAPFTGSPTEGIHPRGNGSEPVRLYGEAYKELSSYRNSNGSIIFKMTGVTNLSIYKNDLDTESSAYRFLMCTNVYLADNTMYGCFEASLGGVNAVVMERNTLDGYANTISGDGIYCAHNRMVNRDINNREIMTSDGPGHYGSSNGKTFLAGRGEGNACFVLDKPFAKNILAGKQLLIQEGVGEGQMRRIISNDGYEITVDSPFAVEPVMKESKVSVMSARSNTVFYSNYMYNAGDFQFYGTQLNTLMMENTFEKMRGFVARGCNIYNFLQPNWYLSICGNHFLDANYLHNVGYTTDWLKALPKLEIWGGSPAANNQLCTVVRGNRLEDGFFILIKGDGDYRPIVDLTVQGNRISDAEFGIYLTASTASDGVAFLGNQYEEVEKPYCVEEWEQKRDAENDAGDKRFLFLDAECRIGMKH